ncbi:MAG: peptidoglycan-binding protein [Defluviitaleaceae bacterium]|nr:peptidoglycan-binding protein [Defluviitaleaceae bacterium]MCL2274897.1 peptidoglycan-binding protein [Defluviitaleaceae bacterium]
MYEIVNSFLELPIGVRFILFLALILILYWLFGRLLFKAVGIVLLLIRKLIYGLYLLLEIPISALHGAVGGVFATMGQGLSNGFGKIHAALDRGFNAFNKPKTIHGGKAFLIFLLLGAFLIIPYFAGLESDVFTFWKYAYLEREERVVYFIEGTTWFENSVSATADLPQGFGTVPATPPPVVVDEPPQLFLDVPQGFVSLQRYDSGNLVAEIQLRLQELGFYDGPISGNFGPLTKASVILFQETMGLEVNGIFDIDAWILLFAR